jgi:hypothetical protein
MATRDEILQGFKKRVAKLEHEVERVKAVKACINAANKYQTYHCISMRVEETHLFALKTPGACVEMRGGIYDEPEGVLKWKKAEGYGSKPEPLRFTPGAGHPMTIPIVEVAKDGKTAKGLWIMYSYYGENWAAGQFAMDFIKEDGEWKIWKYNTSGLIYSPYEKGWHKENQASVGQAIKFENERPVEMRPSRPPAYPWSWSPDEYFQNIPPIPLSYETWDDSLACIPVPGRSWTIEKFE